jgi:AcrR family transcriptional regulator
MVMTPWGDSDSLRARRLPPGPGTPREEVEKNQRERLFGAMVACVAEKGYEPTTVADLAELSGVSSRTFYDLFEGKQACYLAALEAMIQAALIYAASNSEGSAAKPSAADWDKQARADFGTFAEMIVAQPAAARMALIDSFVAGPEVLDPLERAVEGFEALTRQTLSHFPERADMPPEMITAHIGAMREIASARLRRGTESELPALMDDIWDLISSYRPPPTPLRFSGRLPPQREESLEAHDHAERVLRALAVVVSEKGYAKTTVEDVVRRAGMSATTFYANFDGKEDAMLAAIDSAGAQMVAAVIPAFRRATDWPDGIRAGFGALCNFLASRPALAKLVMMEVYAAGSTAIERRAEALRPIGDLSEEGFSRAPDTPPIVAEAIAGGVYTLAYRQIRDRGPRALPALAPICTYIALAPFLGAEEACVVANGSGQKRG